MSEVLSQSEIDALLQALSSGDVDVQEMKEVEESKKVKKYDFRNPQKIAKDQLRTLEIIHENLGRLFQTFLSGYLRTPVKASILSVDQIAYSEFSNAISNPAFLSIIDLQPLNGQILFDMSTNVIYAIIDRLLGGDGTKDQEIRSFTEIELSLLESIMHKVMPIIKEAWNNVVDLNPNLDKIESNPQFAQVVPDNETIALITMSLEVGSKEGMFNICIPYLVIEPILDKLSTRYWFSTTKNDLSENELNAIKNRVMNTRVYIKAELGSTFINVKDILSLQKGDVIRLDRSDNGKARIRIGSNIKFVGNIGTTNNKMAVKITNVVKDGDDKDE
ncbi:flagellar motor switch protein FliM [Schnuerera sp. xch1]|uniref:flagellar motor switch protein FliM n=1 Tax=Schnuerera sp. xch1 TaxID=2874283 RepID=UPI001CBB1399|nr:flagellar motor switch protein FliM [Schnuerera sp. xch1]MBZ2173865.1 flagellar motor switch protein FliM [Schnuerera sp. xch1]